MAIEHVRAGLGTVALSALSMAAFASDPWSLKQGYEVYSYAEGSPKLAPHLLVFLPAGFRQKQSPLLVILHGASSGGDDVQKLKANAVVKHVAASPDFPFITVSPQASSASYGVFDAEGVNALVDALVNRLPVDRTRIYLTGSSTGGMATWRIAAAAPDRYAAIVPVSRARPDVTVACALKQTPVWAFHNEKDSTQALRPVKEMIDAIVACDGKAKLTVYPRDGHDAWTASYSNRELYDWLAGQRR